jgi:branched-chain amino acid transport system permease protein
MDITGYGLMMFLVGFFTVGLIYAVGCIGVNINWGFTGLFNVGVAGFFAVGAYTSAILTAGPNPGQLGGFGLPVPVGMVAAMLLAGVVAVAVGRICLRLRSDYLAIATVGIAELIRVVVRNYQALGGGPYGVKNVPRPFESLQGPWPQIAYLLVVAAVLLVLYLLIERAWKAPWGRVLRAIRENETAAAAAGKNVEGFRLQAFVLGSAIMGLFGALFAHYTKFIGPEGTEPLQVTFLPWVMLIVGGSGNNKGAIVGAVAVWGIWTLTELLSGFLPPDWALRFAYLRIFMVGLLLQIVIQFFPRGLVPEKTPTIRRRGNGGDG